MVSVFDLLQLTDRYERKARLLPAILSVSVVVPGTAPFSLGGLGWLIGLSAGVGLAAVCAVGLAYVASAAGRQYERKLWPRWPYDAPTNRWLHPDDTCCSQGQRQLWYEAIKRLVGLEIPNVAAQGDEGELDRVINDAVRALRHQFRGTEGDGLLAAHNEDYGFARNLAGLRLFWLPAAGIGAVVAWAVYLTTGTGLIWGAAASVVLIICLASIWNLPEYVRQRSERYTESFFGTLMALDRASGKRHPLDGGEHQPR